MITLNQFVQLNNKAICRPYETFLRHVTVYILWMKGRYLIWQKMITDINIMKQLTRVLMLLAGMTKPHFIIFSFLTLQTHEKEWIYWRILWTDVHHSILSYELGVLHIITDDLNLTRNHPTIILAPLSSENFHSSSTRDSALNLLWESKKEKGYWFEGKTRWQA